MMNLIKLINNCRHENIDRNLRESYCPDCGAFVELKYYIVRCSCCHIKRKGTLIGSKIVPSTLFCHNCGGNLFYLEETDRIDAFNLDYIVITKKSKIITPQQLHGCQIWVETPPRREMKLLIAKDR